MRRSSSESRPARARAGDGPLRAAGDDRDAGELDLVAVVLEVHAQRGRQRRGEEAPS